MLRLLIQTAVDTMWTRAKAMIAVIQMCKFVGHPRVIAPARAVTMPVGTYVRHVRIIARDPRTAIVATVVTVEIAVGDSGNSMGNAVIVS
jgi:hypothetical protein